MNERVLTVPDLASRWQTSTHTVRRWAHAGMLPPTLRLPGDRFKWSLADIKAWEHHNNVNPEQVFAQLQASEHDRFERAWSRIREGVQLFKLVATNEKLDEDQRDFAAYVACKLSNPLISEGDRLTLGHVAIKYFAAIDNGESPCLDEAREGVAKHASVRQPTMGDELLASLIVAQRDGYADERAHELLDAGLKRLLAGASPDEIEAAEKFIDDKIRHAVDKLTAGLN